MARSRARFSVLLVAAAAAAGSLLPARSPGAELFSPDEVTLLDSPFKRAMRLNADYLLSLEPDRLLHNTRAYAGLEPKGALYGGWESAGIAGHILGHYLTAMAWQYRASGDKRFKERIDYTVAEMALCQKAYGDGYIGALPPLELQTLRGFAKGVIEPTGPHTFKGGAWVPWYTEHKVLNGLKDAWVIAGSEQARVVALALADWVDAVTRNLRHEQLQRMLSVEHGGMMDVLAQLYQLTGERRYLEASRRFYHEAVMDPLAEGRDELAGKHANTQIPKVIGEARLYEATSDPRARAIAENFWSTVVAHHTYVNGGNSDDEYFFPEAQTPRRVDAATAETCNTNNMLKLTEHLLCWEPRAALADYYERALYNHILASQESRSGMFAYFLSLEPGLFKSFSTPFDSFWCCVGTGMENHAKYGAAIYARSADALFVNLFIPSEAHGGPAGLAVRCETRYPETGGVTLTMLAGSNEAVDVRIRCLGWASQGIVPSVNGTAQDAPIAPGSYGHLRRRWKAGDRVSLDVPLSVRVEPMPAAPDQVAFLWGPVVLAGILPPRDAGEPKRLIEDNRANLRAEPVPVPALVPSPGALADCLDRDGAAGELVFHTRGLLHPLGMELRPLWDVGTSRYTVYWRVEAEDAWKRRGAPLMSP
jgi:uncharacterized protein